ncbi:hypothetical protein SAMN05216365_14239 [Porphyromonadaceae bacterium NLAE-zl-C104]|nr:hypothetical protein SAMN05216365_14239 [Porphyromonadaceae bacterium NLAE-zl-C104]
MNGISLWIHIFIRFWFNYFDRHRSLIEIKNFVGLQAIIKSDYPTYSGIMLERYFKQQFAESFQYRAIGSWWEPKGNQNEIDIVALKLKKNQAIAAEVKRQKKNFKPEPLAAKVEPICKKGVAYNIRFKSEISFYFIPL